MLYFLYGEDDFRLSKKIKEIEAQYRKVNKAALAVEKFNCPNSAFKEVWDKFLQQSMFVAKKLFFLGDAMSADESFKKDFIKKIKEIVASSDIMVIFQVGKIKKTDKLMAAILKASKSQEFSLLDKARLKKWAEKELVRLSAKIDEAALLELLKNSGSNLWALSNEIAKLASYSKNITIKDVSLFTRGNLQAEIFSTIDLIANKDKKTALGKIKSHLDMGDNPFYLLSMIAYQFRNLLAIKTSPKQALSARSLGMHPFVFQKSQSQANRFSLEELKKIYQQIMLTDLSLKTSNIAADEALKMLIAEI